MELDRESQEKETGMREHSKELGEGRISGAGTVLIREACGY